MDVPRSSTGSPDALLTEAQASDLLAVSVRTLQDWRLKASGPPFVRLGRAVRYRRPDLSAWLETKNIGEKGHPGRRLVPPVLPAVAIREEGQPVRSIVVWCPWCEDAHFHGPGGGGGNRVAHCMIDRHSPLRCTGYDLDIVGASASRQAIVPDAVMAPARRLHQVLEQASGGLRAAVLRHLLGLGDVRGGVIRKETRKGTVWIFGSDHWLVERAGAPDSDGVGFLRLAALLFGVPPGIAAVRFLEAATFDRLDEEAAFAIERVIREWLQRGAPSRGEPT